MGDYKYYPNTLKLHHVFGAMVQLHAPFEKDIADKCSKHTYNSIAEKHSVTTSELRIMLDAAGFAFTKCDVSKYLTILWMCEMVRYDHFKSKNYKTWMLVFEERPVAAENFNSFFSKMI